MAGILPNLYTIMPSDRFWKVVFIVLIITLVVMGIILFFLQQALTPTEVQALVSIATNDGLYIIGLLFVCLFVLFIGLQITYRRYVKPLKKLSSEARVIYATNPSHRIHVKGNKDLQQLSAVINNFADMFENLNRTITEQILQARKETEKERNLLAAIMAELPQGVIICNKNGRILLFNSLAKEIFTPDSGTQRSEIFLGLGRSVFHLIDKALISHAILDINDRIHHKTRHVASYFITPGQENRLISVETIPVLDPEKQMTGFILAFQDITDEINLYDITHEKLTALKNELSTHAGRVRGLLDPSAQTQLIQLLELWPRQYDEISQVLLDAISTRIPLTKYPLKNFLSELKHRMGDRLDINLTPCLKDDDLTMLMDTYSFTAALIFVFFHLSEMTRIHDFHLALFHQNGYIVFDISWQGLRLQKHRIESLLEKRINSLPSLFYVLKQNKAELKVICDDRENSSQIHIIARAGSKILLKEKHQSPIITGSRPEFFDFDLFRADEENQDLLGKNLNQITYTVFDTETTGLNPEGGDEIISIAAVRIVNNRIIYQDIFEELVDPKRDIPMESYKIHGINYDMVAGKKDILRVLPGFRDYSAETVLVGHNIAFDMKMLKVKEKPTGIRILNPVLDTLLLSAILHPVHTRHDMESIAKRVGVDIIGRHTALGDAIATAKIFLKLLPILYSNGVLTLQDAIKASKKTYYARLKY